MPRFAAVEEVKGSSFKDQSVSFSASSTSLFHRVHGIDSNHSLGLMEFRGSHDDGLGMPVSLGYSPPPLRASAFSKPSSSSRNGLGLSPPTPAAADPDPSPMSISSSPGRAAPFSRAASTKASASSASDGSSKYRECLKNHAASIGGHVVDGCGEFMPSNDDSYKCAACSCHRSFHRKDSQPPSYYCTSTAHGGRGRLPLLLPPPPPAYRHHPKPIGFQSTPPIGGNTSLSGGTTTESSSEEQMGVVDTQLQPTPVVVSRKRFRTKFTSEQKEKMMCFAESVGWRFQKQDDAAIEHFCNEIGVRRKVFKVWMHNNKHSLRKQQLLLQHQPHYLPHEQIECHHQPPQQEQH